MESVLGAAALGFGFGFAIAMPVGPIGLLCIRHALAGGFRRGLTVGLGAATADGAYGLAVALGLTIAAAQLGTAGIGFGIVGGLVLVWLGVRALRTVRREDDAQTRAPHGSGARLYLLSLGLTIANPMTILVFMGLFAALGGAMAEAGSARLVVVAGVFLGSLAWWLVLSLAVSLLRHRLPARALRWIDLVSGVLLVGFGVKALWGSVETLVL